MVPVYRYLHRVLLELPLSVCFLFLGSSYSQIAKKHNLPRHLDEILFSIFNLNQLSFFAFVIIEVLNTFSQPLRIFGAPQ